MTNEFRWHARLQQNYNTGAAASRGSQASRSLHWYGGNREGELELALASGGVCHPLQVWLATVFVSHFTAAFQAMPKQKFGFFCMPATLPVIYTPPCYLLRNVEFFRKDNSHPGEEKLICSISPTKPGHFHRLLQLNPQVYLFLKKHKEIR